MKRAPKWVDQVMGMLLLSTLLHTWREHQSEWIRLWGCFCCQLVHIHEENTKVSGSGYGDAFVVNSFTYMKRTPKWVDQVMGMLLLSTLSHTWREHQSEWIRLWGCFCCQLFHIHEENTKVSGSGYGDAFVVNSFTYMKRTPKCVDQVMGMLLLSTRSHTWREHQNEWIRLWGCLPFSHCSQVHQIKSTVKGVDLFVGW